MKRLLPLVSISFLVGIFLYQLLPMEGMLFALAVVCLVFLFRRILAGRITERLLLVCCLLVALGFSYATGVDSVRTHHDAPYSGKSFTAYGRISDIPQTTDTSTKFVLEVFGADFGQGVQDADLSVEVTIYQAKKAYRFGEAYRMVLTPDWFEDVQNEGGFDGQNYAKAKGIWSYSFAKEATIQRIPEAERRRFGDGIVYLREFLIDTLSQTLNPEAASLAKAVTVGYKADMPSEIKDAFARCGISHLIAVSGMHVGLVFLLVCALLNCITKNQKAVALAGIGSILFFAFLMNSSPSTWRAAIMYILYLAATLFQREKDVPNVISLAALLLLLGNPFSAFDVSFQLTFLSTVGIIWLSPLFVRLLSFLPLKLAELLSVTLAATVMTLPVVAYYFYQISLVGPLANLIFVPLLPLMMACSALCALLGWIPILGEGVACLTAAFLNGVIWLVRLIAGLKYAAVYVVRPDMLGFVCYYTALFAAVRLPRSRREKLAWASGGLSLVLAVCIAVSSFADLRDLSIQFINVGQGDSAFVRMPGGGSMVIDGGGSWSSPDYAGEKIVLPYLLKEGAWRVDYGVVSHYDEDHCGGILVLLRKGLVKTVITPPREDGNENSQEIDRLVQAQNLRRITVSRGDVLKLGESVTLDILAPDKEGSAGGSNENSLIFMLRYGKTSCLFTGDSGAENLSEIQQKYSIKCDILKVAHHGSKNSFSEAFYQEADPQYAVISVGKRNSYGHPANAVIEGLCKAGAFVLRTDESGNVEFRSNGQEIYEVSALRPVQ